MSRSPHLTTDLFLAIDQGGQSTRVAIYTPTGEQVCCYSAACATTHHQPENSPYEHIEQNGEEILAGIRECLQKIQQHLGGDVKRIATAGFAGQGSSLLCWNNQTGEALTPVLSWQDIRGEPYLKNITLTHAQIQPLTGLRLSSHYGATKMRWCLENNENVAQAQKDNCLSIGPIVSYIFWHLLDCKNNSAQVNNRVPSSLRTQGFSSTDQVDTRVRGYDENAIGHDENAIGYDENATGYDENTTGYDGSSVGPVYIQQSSSLRTQGSSSINQVGTRVRAYDENAIGYDENTTMDDESAIDHGRSFVDPGHAQRTLLWNLQNNDWDQSLLDIFKIPRNVLPQCLHHNSHFGNLLLGGHAIPFTASARDQGASLFARGLPEGDTCYINIGTGAFIQRISENLHAPDGLLVSPLWLPKNPTDKKLYAWEATVNGAAAALSFIQQQTGLAVTPQEINDALTLNPTDDCYFLNSVGGLSAPYWRTDLQSHFSDGLSPQEKILAWIESVIFQITINVQLMNQPGAVKKIIISGGFSKADAVCQKIADLTQADVYRSDSADATVQGVACMAAGLPESWGPVAGEDVFFPAQNSVLIARFLRWKTEVKAWLN